MIGPEILSLMPLLEVDRPTGLGLPGVDPDPVLPVPSELPEPEEPPVQLVLDVALLDADRETVMEAILHPGLPADVSHGAPVGLGPAYSAAMNGDGSIGVFQSPFAEVYHRGSPNELGIPNR
jgi:hypothetical protein